jgi:hypothetical protein
MFMYLLTSVLSAPPNPGPAWLMGMSTRLLARLIDTCDQPGSERDCPILHDIETAAATTTSTAQE